MRQSDLVPSAARQKNSRKGGKKMINLEKEIREQPSVLASVAEANRDTVKKAVAAAKAAGVSNIVFAARGTSDHACIYGQYIFAILGGVPCGLATPSAVSQYGAKMNYKNTLVIGVSQSGMAKDVLSVLSDAKASGALTLSITNNLESPLAKEADFHLYCNAGEEISIAATKTFTAQLYLMAMLCEEWTGNKELAAALEKVPCGVAEVLDKMPGELDKFIGSYKSLADAIVLGRGVLYPVALEGALKVLETNRIRMKGYPISDFHHGPMAQVSAGSTVFVLGADGAVINDVREMLAKLGRVGADIILVTDSEALAAENTGAKVLRLPNLGSELVVPFTAAVTMQLVALKLTEVRGIDPDKSEVLNKVTITK